MFYKSRVFSLFLLTGQELDLVFNTKYKDFFLQFILLSHQKFQELITGIFPEDL